MKQGDTKSRSHQVLSSLLTGPNTAKAVVTASGDAFRIRSGSRTEKSLIAEKQGDLATVHKGIAFAMWKLLASQDGTALLKDYALKDVEKNLNFVRAIELNSINRSLQKGSEKYLVSGDEGDVEIQSDEDMIEKILSGPNTVYSIETRSGQTYDIRSGGLEERAAIEKALQNKKKFYDSLMLCLYKRMATEDGDRLTDVPYYDNGESIAYKDFANAFDTNNAEEMVLLIAKLDNGALYDNDEFELDEVDYDSEAERIAAEMGDSRKSIDDKVADLGNSSTAPKATT